MLILIVLLPLIGFFSGSLFGRHLGRVVCIIATLSVFLSLMLSFFLFYHVLSTGVAYKLDIFPWIVVDSVHIDWCFCFDSLTSVMLVVVTFISSLVHLYSSEYMEHDPHLPRFMSYLSLFTFFMIVLVTANNFLQMFVGWEGVGLSSYLLINFWFTRVQANKAAIKAMLINRLGDLLLLVALFAIYFVFSSLDYDVVFCLTPLIVDNRIIVGSVEIPALDMICILLFFGAMGKSAQIGLHTWLPDAMEGPTPVSALIHAATMVTAGVFLIVRCSYLFEFSSLALNIIVCIGSMTAFFAATTGLFQNDLKRVIAYSTCSQLGYMIFACGLSSYDVGVFHLSNHAFFKALLFLGAGSVIHAVADEQDMRRMGGLKKTLPFSYGIMVVGSLSLMGFPFLTGFYSKDTILEISCAKFTTWSHFSYYLGVLGACCTSFYSLRLLFLVFLAEPNGSRKTIVNSHEASWKMGLPLLILSIFSIINGFMTREFFIGLGAQFWGSSIFVLPQNYALVDVEFIPFHYKLLPFFVSILGSFLAYLLYSLALTSFLVLKKSERFKIIYNFLNRKWYFDRIYNEFINQNGLHLCYHYVYKDIDRGLVEKIGPSGIIDTIKFIVDSFKHFQTGFMFHYLFLFTVSILMLILLFVILCSSPITLKMLFFLSIYLIFS